MKNVDWKKVAVTAGAIGVGIALTVATGGLGAASSSVTNSLLRHGVDTVGETVIDTLVMRLKEARSLQPALEQASCLTQ